ncbi:V-type ATP synthase subunit C [Thermoanaerobacterium sp. DL9XJH110]|uniref:V-type ATP synthase subunit C n=1 Tax=Thermoanaerobacterium sp. DL9XJH110 TaxID=3386643 RepID=UPI003BB49989
MARELDFLYASARIKALETKLLGRAVMERILEAEGPEEALKVLSDTDYGTDVGEMENVYDFENVLEKSIKRTYRTVKDSVKDKRLVRFFTLKNDYHNLKVVIKSRIIGTEGKEYFSPLGEISPEEMQKLAGEDVAAMVPESIKMAFRKAVELYEATQDPQQVDLLLDRALFEELSALVEDVGDGFLKNYFEAMVDLTNIKILGRLMQIKADVKSLERALLPGGTLSRDLFVRLFNEPMQNVIEALSSTPYRKVVEEGLTRWANTGSPAAFEKLSDDYLLALARKGLYKPFGIEPVVGYLAARENEVKNLRILMVGKINGISSDTIKERLRDVYV